MAISFDSALGNSEQALYLRTRRAAVLANNLANVDTPNFKARDIDFRRVMQNQMPEKNASMSMRKTNSQHQSGYVESDDMDLLYRIPLQPTIDGNTVDEQMEQAEFMKNALQFQASFTFLNKKFKGLKSALKGD